MARYEESTFIATSQWSLSLSSRDSNEASAAPAAPQSTSSIRLSHAGPASKVKHSFMERGFSVSSAVGNVETRWCRAGPSGSSRKRWIPLKYRDESRVQDDKESG